ncbi:hypothetical protein BOX15_Mlig027360g1 [Macrostomum lignano]|uniref:Uncharacterized protein n=1 Tax=Macrostomum lignano TaxID=282301 RepID=A0A267FZG1_9PLAT|nr:hypothetical protein BOX15_Mlig027360g1 [Macrostomum lignano]
MANKSSIRFFIGLTWLVRIKRQFETSATCRPRNSHVGGPAQEYVSLHVNSRELTCHAFYHKEKLSTCAPVRPVTPMPVACLYFGLRIQGNVLFNGSLKAHDFANANMSQTDIRRFFVLIATTA